MKTRHLTGITTTGTPHLGNYAGMMRPAIAASRNPGNDAFFFLADYHALVKNRDPARLQTSALEIAAAWLAAGLDPERVVFYRQSDIPEIPALTWLLTCVTAKGLLNRAHAYKAAVDQNLANNEDPDAGIGLGLYLYPVLMAADILLFRAQRVPVGRDQVQHLEMARDIAARFNHAYGDSFRRITGRDEEPLLLPEADIDETVATLPGLDGRKMSKSYGNIIPLFAPPGELKKLIAGIVTDSTPPGVPKDPDTSSLFLLYRAFASAEETRAMRQAFQTGIGWGEAKQRLFERIDSELSPLRQRYYALLKQPEKIESILQAGAEKARQSSRPLLRELRAAVGLRPLSTHPLTRPEKAASAAVNRADCIKQFRERSGEFRFRITDSDKKTSLLESIGFQNPRAGGEALAYLLQHPADEHVLTLVKTAEGELLEYRRDGQILATSPLLPSGSGQARQALLREICQQAAMAS